MAGFGLREERKYCVEPALYSAPIPGIDLKRNLIGSAVGRKNTEAEFLILSNERATTSYRRRIAIPAVAACVLLSGAIARSAVPPSMTLQDGAAVQKAGNDADANTPEQKESGRIYTLGSGVIPPRVVSSAPPPPGEVGQRSKFEGVSIVELIVNAEGIPSHIHIVRSAAKDLGKKDKDKGKELDQKAIEAVQQYRFSPALYKNKPVAVSLTIEVKFHIH